MKTDSIRTTVDIPAPLYRKLRQKAAARDSSIRQLILAGVHRILLEERPPRRKRVQFPIIVSNGPKISLTNDQIYDIIQFP